jgi:hypothetical protein
MDNATIAKIAYEVNRAYSRCMGTYEPPWDVLGDLPKNAMIDGVEWTLNNPEAGPEAQHNAWLENKRRAGWTWGVTKNLHNKTSPDLLEYDKLSLATRARDHIFQAVVRNLSAIEAPTAAPSEEATTDVQPLAALDE